MGRGQVGGGGLVGIGPAVALGEIPEQLEHERRASLGVDPVGHETQ